MVVPDSSSLRLTNQLTIEAWIETRTTSGAQPIVSKLGGAGGNNGYQFLLVGNTIQGLFNSPGQGWPSASISSAGLIVTGAWQHVAYHECYWGEDHSGIEQPCVHRCGCRQLMLLFQRPD